MGGLHSVERRGNIVNFYTDAVHNAADTGPETKEALEGCNLR